MKPVIDNPHLIDLYRVLKWYFSSREDDDRGINEARGYACEIVAWRFLTPLSEQEIIDVLLYEVPGNQNVSEPPSDFEAVEDNGNEEDGTFPDDDDDERLDLLWDHRLPPKRRPKLPTQRSRHESQRLLEGTQSFLDEDLIADFIGLNTLEIAAIANAKKFLSQRLVQKTVNDIWCGHIVFWEALGIHTKKKAQVYSKRYVPCILINNYFAILIKSNGFPYYLRAF